MAAPAQPARFATTRWSVVLAAGGPCTPEARAALETLCGAYWFPLYAFARRAGNGAEAASDLVQGFFAQVLEKDSLERADPERGRFRSFLLRSFQNFCRNEHARAQALKRGGGRLQLSLDVDPEEAYSLEPSHESSPEKLYEREWALRLLGRVLAALREDYEARDQGEIFAALKPYLTAEEPRPAAEVAAELQLNEGALRTAVHRLRKRYGEALRRELADTLAPGDSLQDEVAHLLAALAG